MQTVISFLFAVLALAAQAGDQEIFERAQALWDQGQQMEALKTCKELIKNFPTSKYVPDAYLMFGEYYFDQAKLNKALMAYKKVTQFKNSAVFSYALYKTGWCYFNIHEFKRALEQFVAVVKHCDKEEQSTGQKSKLRLEALNDATLAYSHAGKASAAPAFFKRLAPKETGKLLSALAGMYLGDGKYRDAMEVYRHLIGQAGCSAEAPLLQLKIIDCVVRSGMMQNVPPQVRRLAELFGQLDKCLPQPIEEQKEKLDQAREAAEQTLYDLAVFSHEEAAATKDQKTVVLARDLAESYLQLFPNSQRSAEIRGLLQ